MSRDERQYRKARARYAAARRLEDMPIRRRDAALLRYQFALAALRPAKGGVTVFSSAIEPRSAGELANVAVQHMVQAKAHYRCGRHRMGDVEQSAALRRWHEAITAAYTTASALAAGGIR